MVVPWFFVCFVLFERSMKLRKTAIEQESLQAAYSFLKQLLHPVTIFGPATPLERCSFKAQVGFDVIILYCKLNPLISNHFTSLFYIN